MRGETILNHQRAIKQPRDNAEYTDIIHMDIKFELAGAEYRE
jgi:hypothetical protein